MYRSLKPDKLHETITLLELRISERFPASSLSRLSGELAQVSLRAQDRVNQMQRPILGLRVAVVVLLVVVGTPLVLIPFQLRLGNIRTTLDFIQVLEPALGTLFFLGAFVLTMIGLELRIKRNRVLSALHELRALAHIVDMHQLTKDPTPLREGHNTASSPSRDLSPYDLTRYYDYCSELLSLIAKLAALYVQGLPDPQATTAVDEIEGLCTGLSSKIWQKTMLVSVE